MIEKYGTNAAEYITATNDAGEVLNYDSETLSMELDGNAVAGNKVLSRLLVNQYLKI